MGKLELVLTDPQVEQVSHEHDARRRVAKRFQKLEKQLEMLVVAVEVHVADEYQIARAGRGAHAASSPSLSSANARRKAPKRRSSMDCRMRAIRPR